MRNFVIELSVGRREESGTDHHAHERKEACHSPCIASRSKTPIEVSSWDKLPSGVPPVNMWFQKIHNSCITEIKFAEVTPSTPHLHCWALVSHAQKQHCQGIVYQ